MAIDLRELTTRADAFDARTAPADPRRPTARGGWAQALVLAADLAMTLAVALAVGARSAVAVALATVATLAVSGGYGVRLRLDVLADVPWLLSRVAIGACVAAPVALQLDSDRRLVAGVAAVGAALLVARTASYAVLRAARTAGVVGRRTVLLGMGEVGTELAAILTDHPEYGLRPVGYVDEAGTGAPLPRLGSIAQLGHVLSTTGADVLVVAYSPAREADLVDVLRAAAEHDVEIYVVPRFFDLGIGPRAREVEDVWSIPLFRIRRAATRCATWRAKRAVDVVVSGLALVALAPVMAAIAAAVKLSSPGPLLFRQDRVGQHGRPITVLKFRSMTVDHAGDTTWSAGASPHVTPVGRVLRKTSLDELPQLWNVLRGDMTLVGPRPERPFFAERFAQEVSGYDARHRAPAGLTGWAQVHGLRGDTSIKDRARFDNFYIENWSLWRDLTTLVRTLTAVLRGS